MINPAAEESINLKMGRILMETLGRGSFMVKARS